MQETLRTKHRGPQKSAWCFEPIPNAPPIIAVTAIPSPVHMKKTQSKLWWKGLTICAKLG